jgi:uncharacterized membrane protein (UPF0127 family)
MMRVTLCLVVLEVALGGGCSRTTPEPSSSGGASPSSTPSANDWDAFAGRCVLATPEKAPPEVTAVPESKCPKDPDQAAPLRTESISIDAGGKEVTLDAEMAITAQETERGLMYRRDMAPMHGMFFSLGSRKDQTFWMHNTCIPLDMLFVDQDGLIVGILENVPPMNDLPRSVGCFSTYVLEMNAGWCRKQGVRAGQKMKLPRL